MFYSATASMRRRASDIARGVSGMPYMNPHYTSPAPGAPQFGHALTVPQAQPSYTFDPPSHHHGHGHGHHGGHNASSFGSTSDNGPSAMDHSLPAQNANLSISPAVSRIISSIPPSLLSARVRTLTQSAMASPAASAAAVVAAHHSAVAAAISGNNSSNSAYGNGDSMSDSHSTTSEPPSELAAAARALRAAAEANDDDDSSVGDEHRKMRKNTR